MVLRDGHQVLYICGDLIRREKDLREGGGGCKILVANVCCVENIGFSQKNAIFQFFWRKMVYTNTQKNGSSIKTAKSKSKKYLEVKD